MIRVEDSLNFHIIRTGRLLRQHLSGMTQEAGELTPEQWFVLNRLRHRGALSQVELGDHTLMDRPNISRMVAQLEQRGWIRRTQDPDDGRRQLVELSPSGLKVHDRIARRVPKARGDILDGIDAEDAAVARRVLLKMEENLSRLI